MSIAEQLVLLIFLSYTCTLHCFKPAIDKEKESAEQKERM